MQSVAQTSEAYLLLAFISRRNLIAPARRGVGSDQTTPSAGPPSELRAIQSSVAVLRCSSVPALGALWRDRLTPI